MYRITFDPKTSKFLVQVLSWGLFWKTCVGQEFVSYSDALAWTRRIGLADAYKMQLPRTWLYGGAA